MMMHGLANFKSNILVVLQHALMTIALHPALNSADQGLQNTG
jgi:hypothetical protein